MKSYNCIVTFRNFRRTELHFFFQNHSLGIIFKIFLKFPMFQPQGSCENILIKEKSVRITSNKNHYLNYHLSATALGNLFFPATRRNISRADHNSSTCQNAYGSQPRKKVDQKRARYFSMDWQYYQIIRGK